MKSKPKKSSRRGCVRRILPSVVVVVLLLWAGSLLVSHRKPHTEECTRELKVLTYNTHQMEMYAKSHQNRVIRYLQRQEADVVCLQEVDVYKDEKYLTLPELRKALHMYPYTYFDFKIYNKRHQYGIAVFSKYPLLNKHTVRNTSRGNISDYCDVAVGKDTFRLFNNHLESNKLDVTDLPDSIESEAIKESAHRIGDKLQSARAIRHEQARAIRQEIDSSPYPVIVTGDFNAIPLSYTYLKLRGRDLRDCFLEEQCRQIRCDADQASSRHTDRLYSLLQIAASGRCTHRPAQLFRPLSDDCDHQMVVSGSRGVRTRRIPQRYN